jgi:L-alanine-DL-glutamate epimerase-like enolase superfamily enzyme
LRAPASSAGAALSGTISGIDIALWDIAGKAAKLPLYRLLGGCRERVEAYASGGFYQGGKGIDDLPARPRVTVARGFTGMKMKVGRNPSRQTRLRHLADHADACEVDPEEDIARVAAVRRALSALAAAPGSWVEWMLPSSCRRAPLPRSTGKRTRSFTRLRVPT